MDIARLGIQIDSRGARTATRDLDGFAQAGGRAERAASGIGSAMTAAFAGMAAALASVNVVNTIRGFESGMARVQAISGATATEFAKLRDTAKELGATTEFSATQVAGGMQFLGQAGFDAAQTLEAIPTVLDLATASAVDMATAADIASNILGGFGMEAKDLAGVADVLAKTTSTANTDLGQLGQALSYAAPLASAAGVSIEEAAAAVGKLSDAGIQGSRAGTTLSGVIRRLQNPSKGARDAILEMGLTMEDVDLKGESLAEVMALFAEKGLDAAQAATIFEAEAAPGALVMAKNADAIAEMAGELQNAEGSLGKMAKTMRDTIDGSFKGLGSAVEGLVLALGDAGLTDAIKGAVDGFTSLVRGVTQMPDLGPIATGFGLVAGAAAVMASPLIAASAAITGLAAGAAYLYQNWDGFASAFPGIAGVIEGAVGSIRRALAYLGDRAGEAVSALNAAFSGEGTEALKLYMMAIAQDAKAFGAGIVASLLETGQRITEAVGNWFAETDFEQAAIDGLTKVVDQIERLTGFKIADTTQIGTMVTLVASAANSIKDGAGASLVVLTDGVSAFVAAFDGVNVSREVMDSVANGMSALGSAMQGVGALVGAQIASIGAGLKLLFSAFDGSSDPGAFGDWLGELASKGLKAIGISFEGLAHGMNVAVQAVNGFANGNWEGFAKARGEFAEFLSMDGENLVRISAAQAAAMSGNLDDAWQILKGIKDTAPLTAQEMTAAADKVMEGMTDTLDSRQLEGYIEEFKTQAGEGEAAIEALREKVESLREMQGGSFSDLMLPGSDENSRAALDEVLSLIDRVDASATTAAASMQNITGDAASQVASVSESVEGIGKAAEAAKQNLATLEAAAQPIATAVESVTTQASASLDTLVSDMGTKGTAGINALASGVSNGSGQVVAGVQSVIEAALAALGGFAAEMERAGQQAMEGLARGITTAAQSAADAAAEASAAVVKAAKDALEIKSPSRAMARVGADTMAGFAQGIRDNTSEAVMLAGGAGADVLTAFDDGLSGGQGQDTLAKSLKDTAANASLAADSLRAVASAKLQATQKANAAAQAVKQEAEATKGAVAQAKALTEAQSLAGKATDAVRPPTDLATEAMERFGAAGEAAAAKVAGAMDGAKKAAKATASGLDSLLNPIFNGLKNGDLSNVGQQILGNARNSFLTGAQNWLTTGKGGFLGLGSAFKSLGSGTLGGIVSGAMPIIGAISTAINFFKTTTKVLDKGLRLTVTGTDALLESYKKVEKSRFFGLSKKVSTSYEEISGKAADQLSFAVANVQDAAIESARAIGVTSDAFAGFSWQAKVSGGDADQLEGMLSEMADEFAALALAGHDVIRGGEGAAAALEALAGSLTSVNAGFELLGLRLMDVSVMSADAARDITDMFGGLDQFSGAITGYYEAFYSEAERMEASVAALTRTLADAGINVVPQTTAQYRELVQAFSDAGLPSVVAQLIQAAPLFVDGVQAMADVAIDVIGDLYAQTARLIQTNIRLIDRGLSRLDREADATAQAFGVALAKLRAGIVDEDAIDTVSSASEGMFGSAAAWKHAQSSARVALLALRAGQEDRLTELDAIVSGFISIEEPLTSIDAGMAQLNGLVAQLVAARDGAAAGLSDASVIAEARAKAERAATLAEMQQQLKSLVMASDPGALSIGKTIYGGNVDFSKPLSQQPESATALLSDGRAVSLSAANAQVAASEAERASILAARAAGIETLREQIEAMGAVPAYARGTGFHPGGMALVGEQGPELVNMPRGSRVMTANQTRRELDNSALIAEVRALRAEVAQLRTDSNALGIQTVRNTGKLRRLAEKDDAIGIPSTREDA